MYECSSVSPCSKELKWKSTNHFGSQQLASRFVVITARGNIFGELREPCQHVDYSYSNNGFFWSGKGDAPSMPLLRLHLERLESLIGALEKFRGLRTIGGPWVSVITKSTSPF